MKKVELNIYGGTAVRPTKNKQRITSTLGLALLLLMAMTASGYAQGSIFGTVTNSDLSSPANGDISFVGYLDDTDEEIRIETSDGAGYDAGNWFDDFQNYLTEAPGNAYDYHFHNAVNGEGFQLSSLVPSNSFQQENVVLAPVAWPAAPAGLTGVTLSGSSVLVNWNGQPGLTYHVYRRLAISNGSFFRVDNPAGPLADPGIADSFFVDNTVDGVSSYAYLIIAEDGSGNLSPHSVLTVINSAAINAPVASSITPVGGTASGGTLVDVYGSGFDPAGVDVLFGATPVTATVISPWHVSATAPAGAVGVSVDITITNTASAQSSNILAGAYTYSANAMPTLAAIGAQVGTEGTLLTINTFASDLDGDTAIMSCSTPPGSAIFVDNGNGTGTFSWNPAYTDAGVYNVTFYATDAVDTMLVDSELVQITINEAGNQVPVMALLNDTTIAEASTLSLVISVSDADGEIPSLSAVNLPTNATFVDSLNGTGIFEFSPDFTQAGVYDVIFKGMDAALAVDSIVVQITVTDLNQMPVLAAIGAQAGAEASLLSFLVTSSDPDGTIPVLTISGLPGTAVFTDSLNGVGLFEWTPTFTDSGAYIVTFYATDAGYPADIDSEQVTITINDGGNQAPLLAAIGAQAIGEGGSLNLVITATDADGTVPALRAEGLPVNATFVDSLNGTGVFDFNPDFTQSGVYSVVFIADDGLLADSEFVDITVSEAGNVPPTIDSLGDFVVNEGDSMVVTITALDPDGGAIMPALSVSTTLNNYTFTDNGDGSGTLSYLPDFYDSGIDTVRFFATDFGTPQQTISSVSQITTTDINQPPAIDSIGPFAVAADDTLRFTVTASDATDPDTTHSVFLSALSLPPNATFVDNGDGTGSFVFQPTAIQAGLVTASFLAVDQGTPQQSATLDIDITVVTQNARPVIAAIGPQAITEGNVLIINVSASDPDGPAPAIDTANAPPNSTFLDNGDGTAVFTFTPGFMGGTRLTSVQFTATDGIAITKTNPILIQVYDAGNQAPVFDSVPAPSVVEGDTLVQLFTAYDPDGGSVVISVDASTLPTNATFVDSGNGVAEISFMPDFTQAGLYDIDLIVSDGPEGDPGTLSDTQTVTIDVIDAGNQLPILYVIADQTTMEGLTLQIGIVSSDLDGTFPALSAAPMPANATLNDLGDGTAIFEFSPDLTQAGNYQIWFYASDGIEIDSQIVSIDVLDNNQLPFVFSYGGRTIYEADTLYYDVDGFDADGTIPLLGATLSGVVDSLPPNMTFVDNLDGTGRLTFIPDYTQGGSVSNPVDYDIVFSATDASYPAVVQTSPVVTIGVISRNEPPTLFFPDGSGPFTLLEGTQLVFNVSVIDGDAVTPPTLTVSGEPDSNFIFPVTAGNGTVRFDPDYTQSGTYILTFIGVDDSAAADTQVVQIDVTEAGNQTPVFSQSFPDTLLVPLRRYFELFLDAIDPELDSVSIVASPVLGIATWIDNGDGTCLYSFTPDSTYLDSSFSVTFISTDHPYLASDTLVVNMKVVKFLRGDLDNNKRYTMNDLANLLGYLFRYGPPPAILETADVDGDGASNIGDITYLIRYLYFNGPQPPP